MTERREFKVDKVVALFYMAGYLKGKGYEVPGAEQSMNIGPLIDHIDSCFTGQGKMPDQAELDAIFNKVSGMP